MIFVVSRVQVESEDMQHAGQSGAHHDKGHGKQWDHESPDFEEGSANGLLDAMSSMATLLIEVRGTKSIPKLAARIAELSGVVAVQAGDTASD
jgi:putative Mg2+ transporter-C (MgtC) family protein